MYKIIALDKVRTEELTAIWNMCWPSFSEGHLKAYIFINRISLQHSIGLTFCGKLIGFSFLGLFEDRGWIASIGITPDYRGKGFSKVLLNYQLGICKKLNLRNITLEVKSNSWMAEVYQSFGFRVWRELVSFVLTSKDLYHLDIFRYDQYSTHNVDKKEYFEERDKLGISFPWRKQKFVLSEYKNTEYSLGPQSASGSLITADGLLLDVWASSAENARKVLASVSQHVDKIVINNQIMDYVSAFLTKRQIKPVNVEVEMVNRIN